MNAQERAAMQQALDALEKSGCVAFKNLACRCNSTCASYTAALALRAALAQQPEPVQEPEPAQEPGDFDHGIGADRFKVVRGAFWWHVLIGDSPTEHGKFRSRAGAEKMAADLLREFRNGAFVQHSTHPPQRPPLTDEEIAEAVREADLDWQAGWTLDEHEPNRFTTLARAIERKVRGETE